MLDLCILVSWFRPDNFFSVEKAIQIYDSYFTQKQRLEVKNVVMMDLFLTNTQLFTAHNINWWTGVVWITCGLLWCFYQLFGFSFWRHPFTADDPLVSKWCNATFLQICSNEETNSSTSWMAWGWLIVRKFSLLGKLFLQGHGWSDSVMILHLMWVNVNL